MRKVFENIDSVRIGHYQSILESQGIQTVVKNSSTSALMGAVPFSEVFPELWVVNDADEQEALRLIQKYQHPTPTAADDWACPKCGADVPGELTECWKCGVSQTGDAPADQSARVPQVPTSEGKGGFPVGVFVAAGVVFGLLVFTFHQNRAGNERPVLRPSEQTLEYDFNKDGRSDHFYTYQNDVIVRVSVDRNADGRVDQWDNYGSDGKPESSSSDENFDGKPDAWFVYRHGQVETMKRDSDFNGRPDWISTYRNGVAVESICIPNELGPVTCREVYVHGVLREVWTDENRDGKLDHKTLYDPFGRQLERIRTE